MSDKPIRGARSGFPFFQMNLATDRFRIWRGLETARTRRKTPDEQPDGCSRLLPGIPSGYGTVAKDVDRTITVWCKNGFASAVFDRGRLGLEAFQTQSGFEPMTWARPDLGKAHATSHRRRESGQAGSIIDIIHGLSGNFVDKPVAVGGRLPEAV